MQWEKRGLIFTNRKDREWSRSHATAPTPFLLNNEVLRLYYTARDEHQRSRISFIDVRADNPSEILYEHDKPVIELGGLGAFDDCGQGASQVITVGNKNYLSYSAYNIATTARYRISIGLGVSDNFESFKRYSDGPILDRSVANPCGVSTPFVMKENGVYRMWYTSFLRWEILNGIPEPYYCIKSATSPNFIDWTPEAHDCIPLIGNEGGIVRPSVVFKNGQYFMWYSYRKNTQYREGKANSYRVGFAVSKDGKFWERKDHEVGIDVSAEGWDSEMLAYPYVAEIKGKLMMFYSGNGFGQGGFGYAIAKD